MTFYRAKPATRPATARRLIELPDMSCEAPLLVADGDAAEEEPDEEPDDPDDPAAAVAAGAELLPPTEIGPSVAPAVPDTMEPDGFWPGGEVALVALAAAWNASKLLASVGLIANTIPA